MSNVHAHQSIVNAARLALARAEYDRDEAIRDALADGATVARIVEATGLHRQRIYQIRDGRR